LNPIAFVVKWYNLVLAQTGQ